MEQGQTFEKMISKKREMLKKRIKGSEIHDETNGQLNMDWVGTR